MTIHNLQTFRNISLNNNKRYFKRRSVSWLSNLKLTIGDINQVEWRRQITGPLRKVMDGVATAFKKNLAGALMSMGLADLGKEAWNRHAFSQSA